jgi:hypothetical protein
MTFAVFLCFLPCVSANLSPRNDPPLIGKDAPPKAAKTPPTEPAPAPGAADKQDSPKLVVTDKTEVQLDGRACQLADVPGTASVVSLEVAPDKKTILKIHFQSKK